MKAIEITDDNGVICEETWFFRAEAVHRQLRTQLPADYAGRLREVFANGARMTVVVEGECVRSIAVWRIVENTYEGRRFYIDDLVSDEAHRSQGAGKLLLAHCEAKARHLACDVLSLDSGVHRQGAHRFYFREGMHIPSFSFRKALN